MKISGPCGRLLCCLAYEYEAYKDDRKDMPPDGLVLNYQGNSYQVREASILGRKVYVRDKEERYIAIPLSSFSYDEQGRSWSLIGPLPEL
jgi:cell fate regulator YaaT (PSP1 superfamily)